MTQLNRNNKYKVVCFDLDGTLLPMNVDRFMGSYFARFVDYMNANNFDGDKFLAGLKAGIKAMASHEPELTNAKAFWPAFASAAQLETDAEIKRAHQLAANFYNEDFIHVATDAGGVAPNTAAVRAINTLVHKGYPIVLATMPMFPRRAVEIRLGWAGVDPKVFTRITNYENSRFVKPQQLYYAENLAALGVNGEDVLMVGNNTMEDLAFLDVGADAYLVTDWLLDPVDFPIDTIKHGSMEDFATWCETLPVCEDPALNISDELVSSDAAYEALRKNATTEIDLAAAKAKAAAVADLAAGDHAEGAAESFKA